MCTRCHAVYLSGTLEPNAWVDITATLERKIEALFCHASQLVETGEWFREFLRDSRRSRGPGRRRHVRGGVPPARRWVADRDRGSAGLRWARHSDCARSISIATTPGADRGEHGPGDARRRRSSGRTTACRREARELVSRSCSASVGVSAHDVSTTP